MKAQTKAIVASLVVIALALSAVSGVTYSWWSDTEQTDINVTTGAIDLQVTPVVSYSIDGVNYNSDPRAVIKSSDDSDRFQSKTAIGVTGMAPNHSVMIVYSGTLETTMETVFSVAYQKVEPLTVTETDVFKMVGKGGTTGTYIEGQSLPAGEYDVSGTVVIALPGSTPNQYQGQVYDIGITIGVYQSNIPEDQLPADSVTTVNPITSAIISATSGNVKVEFASGTIDTGTAISPSVTVTAIDGVAPGHESFVANNYGTVIGGFDVEFSPGVTFNAGSTPATVTMKFPGDVTAGLAIKHVKDDGSVEAVDIDTSTYSSDLDVTTVVFSAYSFSAYYAVDTCEAMIGTEKYPTLSDALKAVPENGVASVSILRGGNYTMPTGFTSDLNLKSKTVEIIGPKDAILDMSGVNANDQFVTGATLKFEGVTLKFGKVNYMGLANTASLTYEDCKITGLQFLYGEDVKFIDCSLDSGEAEHCVWTYGAKNILFKNCDFTYSDRGMNCYKDQDIDGGKQIVTIEDCSFYTTNVDSDGAVEINSSPFTVGVYVTMDGCIAPEYGEMVYVSTYDATNGSKTFITVDGVDWITNATHFANAVQSTSENIDILLKNDLDVPISSLGEITGGSGEYKLGGENTETITIDLNGKKLNITTTYWSNLGAKNDNATFTIKNGTMTSSQATGTWNSYDVTFSNCDYVIENVVFEKAIAFDNTGRNVKISNVTINETHDYYAMWICAVGQTVDIDNLTINSDGRGIKIDEQYITTPAKVTLNVSNSSFETLNKAAIMVKSAAGADITVNNVDISKVVKDTTNVVWVDEDAATYANLVSVSGCTMIVEGSS